MQKIPRSNRIHICLLGRRNVGKSSLINALTGQELALVSAHAGTTTDPVYKAMELLPLGPVVLVDTAGLDDVGELGELRVKRTMKVLDEADLVLLVTEPITGFGEFEEMVLRAAQRQGVPVLAVVNKMDQQSKQVPLGAEELEAQGIRVVYVSAVQKQGIWELKEAITKMVPKEKEPPLLGDLVAPGEIVVLVTPIDQEAPKKRLILPQVQVLRDLLDHGAIALVTQVPQLSATLKALKGEPRLVVTDSQVFAEVAAIVPAAVPLTSFSIVFARHKGDLAVFTEGVRVLAELQPGQKVLISEACTHHPIGEDIARVKIPRWLNTHVGGELNYAWTAGTGFPEDLAEYALIVHCGGCMLTPRVMHKRLAVARAAGVPIVNYGILIASLRGILPRALAPFLQEPHP